MFYLVTQTFGKQLHLSKNFKDVLRSFLISSSLNIVATTGDNSVKLHDLNNLQDVVSAFSLPGGHTPDALACSEDGMFLTICSTE